MGRYCSYLLPKQTPTTLCDNRNKTLRQFALERTLTSDNRGWHCPLKSQQAKQIVCSFSFCHTPQFASRLLYFQLSERTLGFYSIHSDVSFVKALVSPREKPEREELSMPSKNFFTIENYDSCVVRERERGGGGRRPNVFLGPSLNDRTILFLLILLVRQVSVG